MTEATFIVRRDNMPDLRFKGVCIAEVSSRYPRKAYEVPTMRKVRT